MLEPLPHYKGAFSPWPGDLLAGVPAGRDALRAPDGCSAPSEGALMLHARREERAALGKHFGASRQLLTMWASGARYPAADVRGAMPRVLGIPEQAWTLWRPVGIAPTAPPSAAAEPPPSAPDGASVVDRMRLAQRSVSEAKTPEDLKLATGKLDALAKLARIESLASKGPIHLHPDWPRVLDALVVALRGVPGALEALEAGLGRVVGEGSDT